MLSKYGMTPGRHFRAWKLFYFYYLGTLPPPPSLSIYIYIYKRESGVID
jgi:hypothetical protein